MLKDSRSVNKTNSNARIGTSANKPPKQTKERLDYGMINYPKEFTRNNVTVPAQLKEKLKGTKKGEQYVGIDIAAIGLDKYIDWRGKDEILSILQQRENIECIYAFDESFPQDKEGNIIGEYDPEKNKTIIESGTVRGTGKTKKELVEEYEKLVEAQRLLLADLLTNPAALMDAGNQAKLTENNVQIGSLKDQIEKASREFKPRKKRQAALVAAGVDDDGSEDDSGEETEQE